MADWLVVAEGKHVGPMSARELKAMAISGKISVDSPVSKMGTNVWGEAGNLKGLFPKLSLAKQDASTDGPTSIKAVKPDAQASGYNQDISSTPAGRVPDRVTQPMNSQSVAEHSDASPLFAATAETSGLAESQGLFAKVKSLIIRFVLLCAALAMLVAAAIGCIVWSGHLTIPDGGTETATPKKAVNSQPATHSLTNADQVSSNSRGPSPVHLDENDTSNRQERIYDELKEERKELEEENRELRKQRDGLKDEADKLQKEVDHLTSMVLDLKQWQRVQIVMVNPTRIAVGLNVDSSGNLVVAHESVSDFTPLAIQAAFNSGRMFISSDPQLTREVSSQFDSGDVLTGNIEKRVRRYFRCHAPIPDEFQTAQHTEHWVTFVDQTSGHQHLGLSPIVAENRLRFVPVSGVVTSVDHDAILPGSAIRGPMERVLPYLDESHFMDQCLLRTAMEMTSKDEPNVHCVSIQVDVDLPDRFQSTAYQQVPNTPVSPYSPILIQGLDVLLRHVAKSQRQSLLNQERAQVRSLEDSVNELEDELLTKLSRLNVTVIDRQMLQHLAEARDVDLSKDSDAPNDRRLLTTHSLRVTVKPPITVGRYHFAVRLYDIRNQQLVFAENADRVDESITDKLALSTDGNYRNYFHDSGTISALKVRHAQSPSYQPLESPIVIRRPARGNRSDTQSDLVYIESPDGADPVHYRSLFSSQPRTIALKDVESIDRDIGVDHIPRHDLFRYMVCRIARQCLPSAGRVTRIEGNKLVVSIGREGGVKAGQQMRLLRPEASSRGQQVKSNQPERLLNVRLTVTNVFEHHCEALVEPSGFESDWPEDYVLQDGDIVIPARREFVSVGIFPPLFKTPDNSSEIAKLVRLRRLSPELLVSEARQLSSNLSTELQDALSALNIAVRSAPNTYKAPAYRFDTHNRQTRSFGQRTGTARVPTGQLGGLQQEGMTHTVFGSIQPSSRSLHRISLGVISSNSGKSPAVLDDGFDFTMSNSQIPK